MITSVFQVVVCRGYFKRVISCACTCMSTSAMEMNMFKPTVIDISPVLRLHKFTDNENAPITLLLPWVTATESALDRFRMLYAARGFNVLTAYSKPINFMWPSSSTSVAADITRYLCMQTGNAPIVVHAFSIGAFMYANVLMQGMDQRQEFIKLQPRIRGQVFDSIVIGSLKEMRVGVAQMLTRTKLLQQLISASTAVYFFLTHSRTVAVYDKMVDAFWKNPCKTPILCYYSLKDPMCHTESMERFISAWEERTRQPAHFRSFPDTRHAEILRAYPEEYRDTLFKYLDTLILDAQGNPIHAKL